MNTPAATFNPVEVFSGQNDAAMSMHVDAAMSMHQWKRHQTANDLGETRETIVEVNITRQFGRIVFGAIVGN